ncbi:MAG: DUF5940 domain-containing protein, partial [Clostridia bacterium]|nr:DUF5940 domain-containing protein [Clostridia bacterium]
NKAMIVGKGSLFLGRMTNLFDGVSVILERNPEETSQEDNISQENNISQAEVKTLVAEAMRDFAAHLLNNRGE